MFEGVQIDDVMELPRNAVFNLDEAFVVKNGMLKKEGINIVRLNEKTLFFNGIKCK